MDYADAELPVADGVAARVRSSSTPTPTHDVVDAGAWLPLRREGRANVLRSLGLVPSALKLFFDTFNPSYYMRPGTAFSINPAQVELVASRVFAVNECFY